MAEKKGRWPARLRKRARIIIPAPAPLTVHHRVDGDMRICTPIWDLVSFEKIKGELHINPIVLVGARWKSDRRLRLDLPQGFSFYVDLPD